MLVNMEAMQRCPINDLVERSFKRAEHVIFPLSNGFMRYLMVNGISQYCGTIDYSKISLQ